MKGILRKTKTVMPDANLIDVAIVNYDDNDDDDNDDDLVESKERRN